MEQRRTKKQLRALAIARQIPALQHSAGSLSRSNLYAALYRQGYYWDRKEWHKAMPNQDQTKV